MSSRANYRRGETSTLWVLGLSLVLAAAPAGADGPLEGIPDNELGWRTAFQDQLHARLLPSFTPNSDLEGRIARVWSSLVGRVAAKGTSEFDPLQQYPVLGFVDEQFYVMKYRAPTGKESFVVRAEAKPLEEVPTLGSTLRGYLNGVFLTLGEIAQEEAFRMTSGSGYHPDLSQLAAQNPFQHGEAIRVPDMGSFKNRVLRFTGMGGRLDERETAAYERLKQEVGPGQSLQIARDHRWGVAVEVADLVHENQVVCRYRTVRKVATVRDQFVGEGRVGTLLRIPRLGPVIEVSGCVERCDNPQSWHRLYPDGAEQAEASPRRPSSHRLPSAADQHSPSGGRGSGALPESPW